MENIRYIVWLFSLDKKIKFNQFHTIANSLKQAIENMDKNKGENSYKVMGVSVYDSLCVNNEKSSVESFINNRFI